MFTLNWGDLGRIIVIGILAYIALIVMLRIAGKRTLTQLNAFDLVITVSIGSVFGTVLLDNAISIFDGMAAFFVLIALQWIFSKTTTETNKISHVIKGEASILYFRGQYFQDVMEAERIEKEEIIQAVRMQGKESLDEVEAVILESNGQFSVLSKSSEDGSSTIPD